MTTVTSAIFTDPLDQQARAQRIRGFRMRRLQNYGLALLGWVIFLGLWQILPAIGLVDPTFSSSPAGWATTLATLLMHGEIYRHLSATLFEMLVGLALSIIIGIPFGILFAWYRVADQLTSSVTMALYAVPYVVLVPLVITWFGIGDGARISIVVWSALFPVLLNTMSGVKNLDRNFIRVAKAFCAPQGKTLLYVVLPGALPYALTGVRLAVGRALVAAVVSEFFMGSRGLGYFISNSASTFNMNAAFAAIVLLSALSVGLVQLVSLVEHRFSSWMQSD